MRKKGLGRGLSALLAETNIEDDKGYITNTTADVSLPIEKIIPNLQQPRKKFDKTKLEELAKSISRSGIIQPVIVRLNGSRYELIAGERRWRAAQLARLHYIPAIIRELTDEQVAEYAIVENIQREDLTPIEEARSYKSLLATYRYTQEEVSNSLGKSRSYISNMLRLLTLPSNITDLLEEGTISIGHARAVIGLDQPAMIIQQIIREQLSVRQTETLVKAIKEKGSLTSVNTSKAQKKDIDTQNLEKMLTFQTKFKITIAPEGNKQAGKLIIKYNNLDELDKICEFFNK